MTTPFLELMVLLFPPWFASSAIPEQAYDSRISLHGRDPLAGSGLCGPLMAVRVPADVHGVTLPNDWTFDTIEILRDFPNLRYVRCERILSAREFLGLAEMTPFYTQILCDVRCLDGRVRFGTNSMNDVWFEDRNGDGVLTSSDSLSQAPRL
ncbi:MAG: hypothetical protein AAFX06_17530 [Planctomycetota bacterium]